MFTPLDDGARKPQLWSRLAGLLVVVFLFGLGILVPMLRPQAPDAPVLARSDAERRILAAVDTIGRSGDRYASVPDTDGRMLRLLAEAINARNVVEIGTSTGVSALWLCLALHATGGNLTTFEIDPGRAATARKHFEKAGVAGVVHLIEGDAHQKLSALDGSIDLAFIDAEKDGYVDYLNQLIPRLNRGGLILAHNVPMVPEYVAAVTNNPNLDTFFYTRGGGLAVTLKKR